MPKLVGENISVEKAKDVRKWIALPAGKIFREAVEARQRLHEEEALSASRAAKTEDDAHSKLSASSMRNARRYQTVIEVLTELSKPETPLQTIKLAP